LLASAAEKMLDFLDAREQLPLHEETLLLERAGPELPEELVIDSVSAIYDYIQ